MGEGEEEGDHELQLIEEAILAPPQASGEHQAYIPMDYAKECIQKVRSFCERCFGDFNFKIFN